MTLLHRVRYLLGQAPAPRPSCRWLAGLLVLLVPLTALFTAVPPMSAEAPAKEAVGVMVDPEGKPVAGIEVKAYRYDSQLAERFRSDSHGRIRVPAAWVRADPLAWDENVVLLAGDSAGHLGWYDFLQNNTGDQPAQEPFHLTLLPLTRTVSGTFVDSQGKPVSGVRVGAWNLFTEKNRGVMAPIRHQDFLLPGTVSDSLGKFRISLPAESSGELENYHPRYAGLRLPFQKGQEDLGRIELTPAGGIAGRVTNGKTGKPISGVRVLARGLGTNDFIYAGYGETITGAKGSFHLDGLPPAGYEVSLFKIPGEPKLVTSPQRVRVTLEKEAEAHLVVNEGRRLRGTVIDFATNKPVPHCLVFPGGLTDEEGQFQTYLPPGTYHIYIADDRGRLPESSHNVEVSADRDPEPVVLKAGPPYEDKRLGFGSAVVPFDQVAHSKDTSYKLVLKFQTPDGPPVGHVLIWRWPQGANHAYQWDSRKGDAVTLEFRPDDEGQKYRLIIEAEGFARPDSPRITVAKSMAPVSVKLEPPVAVTGRGRVVDQDGKPVAGARVRVGLWLGAREYETPWGPEPATDADGKYELRHLRAGDHFRVEAARDGLTRGVSPRLTAEEGAVVSIPDLRLSSAKHTLIGTITDPSGQPVADARVYTTTPVAKETQSNAAGKFVLYDLPADGNRVWVDAPGFIVREFGSLQEGADLRIRLDRLNPDPADFRLQVRLKPRDGGQVKQSEVWVVEKGPPAQLLFYSWPQDGRYDTGDVRTFGPRAGKTMVLAAEAEGYARPKPVEFSAGKRMQALEIELTPAAPVTIHGRVVDGNGKPVAGAGVGLSAQLYREALDEPWRFFGGNDQLPRTDAEGRFTLSGIAVGTRFAVHTGMSGTNRVVSEWRTAEKPGEVTLPDLVLRPGTRTLAGVVVDAEGRTVAGAKVVQRDRLGRVETVTDAQGKFQLEGLPEEKLYLRVEADDFPFWQGVAQAGQADLRVVLR